MILLSKPVICDFSNVFGAKSPQFCPCSCQLLCLNRDRRRKWYKEKYWAFNSSSNRVFRACVRNSDGNGHNFNVEVANSARLGANSIVLRRFSDELGSNDGGRVLSKEGGMQFGSGFANLDNNSNDDNSDSDRVRELSRDENLQLGSGFTDLDNNDDNRDSDRARELSRDDNLQLGSGFTNFQQDPIVDKLRTQLGVIHPIPSPPISKNVFGLFVLFFFIGVVTDKIWNRLKRKKNDAQLALWRQTPTSVSMLLEKDLQRKESVEWVNMVLGKLWKVYKPGLENWIIGLLQPVIDDLKKPDYVERVEVKQFSLGDEPLSVRSVERRTSRRVNDLQYQIGLRYTGGARMLLMLTLKFGILPVMVPVGVQDFDIDGELWVKLRLIPTEPWVGAVQWAFVTLPKVTFELSPFRLFNLMTIPVLSMFLTKLLTQDLPKLFVRPNKIVLDFQEGKAVGPVAKDFKPSDVQEKNKDFVGELSVTLVDARNLSYVIYGKTDPYVVLRLGDQTIRSKKNSQTTVIGPPGEPIWNQDFNMLVQNPQNQKLKVEVVDSLGFMNVSTGTAEVDLSTLQDTVVTDKIVVLTGGWNLLRKGNSGEILVRLTYRAYVEDEEDEGTKKDVGTAYVSEDDASDTDEPEVTYKKKPKISMSDLGKESFMDVLAALIVSEEFQGIVASEAGNGRVGNSVTSSAKETPKSSQVESVSSGDGKTSKGSAVFWLAVVTIVAVVIALNVGGSSVFNP